MASRSDVVAESRRHRRSDYNFQLFPCSSSVSNERRETAFGFVCGENSLIGLCGTAGLVAFFIARFLPLRTFALFNPLVRHSFDGNSGLGSLVDLRLLRPRLAHARDEPMKSPTSPALLSRGEGEGTARA